LYIIQYLSSCPDGTYSKKQSDGYFKSLSCYKNCKTCSQGGDFYLPKNNEISSCYELYDYNIEENKYECIYKGNLKGFFLSNSTAGLISHCH